MKTAAVAISAKVWTEQELLVGLCSGDAAAADEFYHRYAARLYRFITHTLSSQLIDEAEDLLQDTMMALADALPYFRGESSLFTFACGIAHRKVQSYLRKAGRRRQILTRVAPDAPVDAPQQHSDDLANALGRIDPAYRELLILKYVEELSQRDLAATLGISEHALESRLSRARRALSKQLGEDK